MKTTVIGLNKMIRHALLCFLVGLIVNDNGTVEANCAAPPNITNGVVAHTALTARSNATYKCNAGFKLTGQVNLTCVGTAWNGTTPTCIKDTKNTSDRPGVDLAIMMTLLTILKSFGYNV